MKQISKQELISQINNTIVISKFGVEQGGESDYVLTALNLVLKLAEQLEEPREGRDCYPYMPPNKEGQHVWDNYDLFNYCPNCGAKIKREGK